jgi:mevalonate kinase
VNASAYEGEKGYHGTPSGIDNTSSTYGGVLKYPIFFFFFFFLFLFLFHFFSLILFPFFF